MLKLYQEEFYQIIFPYPVKMKLQHRRSLLHHHSKKHRHPSPLKLEDRKLPINLFDHDLINSEIFDLYLRENRNRQIASLSRFFHDNHLRVFLLCKDIHRENQSRLDNLYFQYHHDHIKYLYPAR